MFTWTYSEQVTTLATPEQIWAVWQDAASWPCWDRELEWGRLEGKFVVGGCWSHETFLRARGEILPQ